jgi:hypothetical protein
MPDRYAGNVGDRVQGTGWKNPGLNAGFPRAGARRAEAEYTHQEESHGDKCEEAHEDSIVRPLAGREPVRAAGRLYWALMRAALPLAILFSTAAHTEPPKLPARETLHYDIEWRLINAGRATLSWGPPETGKGWEIRMKLESAGLVSKLYKVDDQYTSLLDPELCAVRSHLIAHEGRRHRETTVTYDAESQKAHYLEVDLAKNSAVDEKRIDIPACARDVLGGLFYLRTLDLQPGESAQIAISDGKKSVSAKVEAQEREEIKIEKIVYKTIRYQAYLFNNVLYRRNARLYVWLTDDARRLPVQIRVRLQFTIGTITLQLQKEEQS